MQSGHANKLVMEIYTTQQSANVKFYLFFFFFPHQLPPIL